MRTIVPLVLCLSALVPVLAQQADKDAAPKWNVQAAWPHAASPSTRVKARG